MNDPAVTHSAVERVVRRRLDNEAASLAKLLSDLRTLLSEPGVFDEATADRVVGAADEALQNACVHGNLEVDSALRDLGGDEFQTLVDQRRKESPYRDRRIDVTVTFTATDVRITIADDGSGFDINALPDPTDPEFLVRGYGRGMLMMRAFTDDVIYNDTGNQVTLVKHRVNGELPG